MFTAPVRFTVWHDPRLFKWTAKWNFVEPNEVWEYSMPTICSELLFRCGIRCTEKMVKKRLECPCQSVDCAIGYGYLKIIIDLAWLSMARGVKVKVEINLSWANITFCLGGQLFCLYAHSGISRQTCSVCLQIRPQAYHHAYRVIGKCTGIWKSLCSVTKFAVSVLLIKRTKTPNTNVLSVQLYKHTNYKCYSEWTPYLVNEWKKICEGQKCNLFNMSYSSSDW